MARNSDDDDDQARNNDDESIQILEFLYQPLWWWLKQHTYKKNIGY